MASTISDLIVQEALARGVPPAIALAVAQKESGIQQWTPNGNLVMGSSGDTGVFQIIPSTARGLGVDPTDLNQNIQGGVSLLAQLYQKYQDWTAALSAYNSGSPTKSTSYANSVLGIAQQFGLETDASSPSSTDSSVASVQDGFGAQLDAAASSSAGTWTIGLIFAGLALGWWFLTD
jgi:hypothetical protein